MFRSLNTKQTGSAHIIALAIVVLAVIGAAGAYVATSGFKKAGSHKTITADTAPEIKALFVGLKAGEYDVTCTYDVPKPDANNKALLPVSGQGTMYLSGTTKMRIEITISGKPGHFVRLGDSVYIWAEGKKEGSKFPFKKSADSSKLSSDTFVDNTAKYNLKCHSVDQLDASLFTVPADIHFVDINSKLNH